MGVFANDRTVFVAGREKPVRVDSGSIILIVIRLLGASEQQTKREYFRLYYVS